uniref:Uncharacterized protein n=1 Tax=Glossina morsitans morsitans TaxID=37546 RepID=A0A1B0G0B2_GLOMM
MNILKYFLQDFISTTKSSITSIKSLINRLCAACVSGIQQQTFVDVQAIELGASNRNRTLKSHLLTWITASISSFCVQLASRILRWGFTEIWLRNGLLQLPV